MGQNLLRQRVLTSGCPRKNRDRPVGVVAHDAGRASCISSLRAFRAKRVNSSGLDLTDPDHAARLQRRCVRPLSSPLRAASILVGHPGGGAGRAVFNPANRDEHLGYCADAEQSEIERAFELASGAQADWDAAGGEGRARLLEAVADKMEDEREG